MRFQRNVYRRGTAGYEHLRRATVWCMRVPDRYPRVIVNCNNEDDVIAAVQMAREENLKLSVCSGGNSWHANHLRDGALLVNLHAMTDYQVDLDTMTGSAQPGLRGSDLYLALREHSVWFPTGHYTNASIGGFLLQGGIAYDNHRTGPACAHVTAVDVVTATGQLVHATDNNEHADLLWAARGAGSGFFGVLTRYYIKLYDLKTMTTNLYICPSKYLEEIFWFCQAIGPTTPTEISMTVLWDTQVDAQAPIISIRTMAYTDTRQEGIAQLSIYEDCPVSDKAIITRHSQATTQDVISANAIDRLYLDSRYHNADCLWTNASIDDTGPIFRAITNNLENKSHIYFSNFGTDNPPPRPPMAFSLDANYYYGVCAIWDNPANEQRMRNWLLTYMKALEPYSTAMPLADENLEDRPTRFMADENLLRLDQIRDKYDPEHRFVQWMGRPW